MSHQNAGMTANVYPYGPTPDIKDPVDTNPSDVQPPGVDEEDDMPQSLEEALMG